MAPNNEEHPGSDVSQQSFVMDNTLDPRDLVNLLDSFLSFGTQLQRDRIQDLETQLQRVRIQDHETQLQSAEASTANLEPMVASSRCDLCAEKAKQAAEAANSRIAQENAYNIQFFPEASLLPLQDTTGTPLLECPRFMSDIWVMNDVLINYILEKLGRPITNEATWILRERIAGLMTGVHRV